MSSKCCHWLELLELAILLDDIVAALLCRVPEQCPDSIRELAYACLAAEAEDRPNVRHIINVIQTSG